MMNARLTAVALALCVVAIAPERRAVAELPWPVRNGPLHNGCASPKDARGVPTEWDETKGQNIAWKIDLEGFGHSTPVIGNGRLWLTAATEEGKQQFVYAIDTDSGRVVHHKLLFANESPEKLGNAVNTYASPSCVLEEDAVYAHFGTYGTARLDPKTAEVVWERRDLPCRHFRGPGSSPIVWKNLLILTFDGIDQQYVEALDKRTGKTVWHTNRSTDYHDLGPDGKPAAEGDNRKAYGTPGLVEVGGKAQIVSVGSRAIFGYDADTGREIWTVTHKDFNAAAPPLVFENTVIINTGSGGASLMAIRLDATTQGDVTESHVVWSRTKGNSRLSAPALDGDRVWMITDNGILYAIDAKTGQELAAQRLGGSFVASLVVAGEHLYACDEKGITSVLRTSIPPEVLAKNQLADGMRSSPAVANGAIYLRTFQSLYKIAGKAPK